MCEPMAVSKKLYAEHKRKLAVGTGIQEDLLHCAVLESIARWQHRHTDVCQDCAYELTGGLK